MTHISLHDKYGDPRMQAARANQLALGHAKIAGQRPPAAANPYANLNVSAAGASALQNPHAFSAAQPLPTEPWQPGMPVPWGAHSAQWMHGYSPQQTQQLQNRFEQFVPKMASGGGVGRAQDFFQDILPPGATLAPNAGAGFKAAQQNHYDMRRRLGQRTAGPHNLPYGGNLGGGGGGGGGGGSFQTTQRPYQPEFESPDRQNYPIHRNLANIYWRLFYKLDALIGNGVDMYAELPWGNFELTGEGVDGEIKAAYERMCEVVGLRALLPYFVREYLVVGEACPHCFYDDNEGIWTYVGMHNPDQLEVIYTPFIKMDPIVRFKPDHRLQQVLNSSSEMVRAVRESMPPELLSALMSGQHIELHPLNFTFLPRKMHPYDVRGTSILSRMWRPLMYEDAIFNASIATARRHAGPIKVAKLGDRTTGWIPDPSHEAKLLELLAQAEMDPHAWLVYHYGIEFDLVGTTDRVMTIDKHWDLIERIKLIALGISKAFLHGEVTYASAASGLTVFLQRLKGLREYFEQQWIYPKFFRPVAEMNQWVKPTQAEAASSSDSGPYIKTRRSHRELLEDGRYIVPTLEWDRQLDPTVESAQITAVTALQGLGVTFSKQYLSSLVGRDWEEELRQRAREAEIEQQIMAENPNLQMALQPPAQPGMGGAPPMGGGGIMPGMPPEAMGFPGEPGPGGEMGAPPMPEAGVHADTEGGGGPGGRDWARPDLWQGGRCGNWEAPVVADLIRLLEGEAPDEELWMRMLEESKPAAEAVLSGDSETTWNAVEDYLVDEGYPPSEILTLEDILKTERLLSGEPKKVAEFNLDQEIETLEESSSEALLVGVT